MLAHYVVFLASFALALAAPAPVKVAVPDAIHGPPLGQTFKLRDGTEVVAHQETSQTSGGIDTPKEDIVGAPLGETFRAR
ncbi:uncharacterized protein FOMMEDRAFT_151783 [Fomitiporia mediterranea MF3/22]|uniref:uncharacterized protein n=1 Tax=Fomitiporia mediterranea (strain MF3/22) TaxID=694068 RepID=UPI00044099EB|nr:uncharacterized protein FOMMEDRAFT_151783 [Fomitiporia mediterranea MF3/22]EJD06513.1 hypothetical protein FOMMEDRAFT_151783 [Fomitiporia mediterranea MF3/22]